jgi:crossover junction endodeoxyribonuclease RuvC
VIILGIDPGLAATGWGILDTAHQPSPAVAWGTITTPSTQPHGERLHELASCITHLCEEHRPALAVVEQMIFTVARRYAQQTSEARGVILGALEAAGVPVAAYTPQQVKLATTGHGHADKREVQEAVQALLCMDCLPRPNHAADALGMAYTWWADPQREAV